MAQAGDVVGGKYEILSLVGKGGMSRVWLARDRRLNKLWAVKEIGRTERDAGNEVVVQSLIAEANLMKRLDHPMLPRVVDILYDAGTIFVVMDYVEGTSLGRVLRDVARPFAEADVIAWGVELCGVLEYLHTMDPPIVYRDMKPDNIVLREDGGVRLVDFGIAREYKQGATTDTRVLGTRGYAAPGQFALDAQTDARADIYSLGVTLYVLVTGRVAAGETYWRPIRQINPALSEGLEHVIAKATQANPADRYQTAADMRRDLENHEKLTRAYRGALKMRLRSFNLLRGAGAVLAIVGVLCLAASLRIKSSTYETLLASARAASVEAGHAGGASPAEGRCMEAIAVDPTRAEAYSELVDRVFKADGTLTVQEASRLEGLMEDRRPEVEGSSGYARLCYDIGVLYFVYFEQGEADESRGYAMSAGVQAAQWFRAAADAHDALSAAGKKCDLTNSERSSAQAYIVIGEFYRRLAQATLEGNEGDVYAGYWNMLESAFGGLTDGDPVMVRLRLCSLIHGIVSSPTYLSGLKRAGVLRESAEALLGNATMMAASLEDDAAASWKAQRMCASVISDDAREVAGKNIDAVYGSAAARVAEEGVVRP